MGNYTIFEMFENARRGRQARNFTTNVPKNSRSQIVFRADIFRKLTLGAPVQMRRNELKNDFYRQDPTCFPRIYT